jgi:N-acylglucosamine-6-phosphate 2-epimerase
MTDSSIRFPAELEHRLIVSCQADPGDPLDDVEALRRMAVSVLRGGAGGLRANGSDAIAAMRRETALPIIGIQKQYRWAEVYITPDFASARAISEAGADVIALDSTARRLTEAEPWPGLIERIHRELHKPVMADIATLDEALAAVEAGADAVASTLCGYTSETRNQGGICWSLVENMVRLLKVPVVLEGHVTQPDEFRRALELGVYAVVVGSAITRPQLITARFVQAIQD